MGRIRGRAAAVFMALLLGLYLIASAILGIGYVSAGQPVAVIMGSALLVLPLIGAWALGTELRFGVRSEQLLKQLSETGEHPAEPPASAAAEYREQAERLLPELEAASGASEARWQDWMRLGVVLDAAGKRKEARSAVRAAIRLSRPREN